LHVYAAAIWEKIITNKDLDLPTQQELLAQFRCEEIANAAFVIFKDQIKDFRRPIEAGQLIEDLGPKMKTAREVATSMFLLVDVLQVFCVFMCGMVCHFKG